MLNSQELSVFSQVDINEVDPDSLVNINTVELDASLPQAERVERFLSQIHNPYCFMSGDTPVRMRFVGAGKPLSQSLLDYFSRAMQK